MENLTEARKLQLLQLEHNVREFVQLYIQRISDVSLGRILTNDANEKDISEEELEVFKELFRRACDQETNSVSLSAVFGVVYGMSFGLPYRESLKTSEITDEIIQEIKEAISSKA